MANLSANLDIFQPGDHQENSVVLEGIQKKTRREIKTTTFPCFSGQLSSAPGIVHSEEGQFNTLDEPIKETILRDVRAVAKKFYQVLYPIEKKSFLKEWDLWGPLILCTFMAIILQGYDDSSSDDGGPEFAEVFIIVWLGSLIVTLNTKLLGGNISFFQSVCVLGYCLLPLCLSLIVCRIILLANQSLVQFILRCVSVLFGFAWATYASMQFLGDCQPERKKALTAFPMFLFYFVIGWMVISHSNQ